MMICPMASDRANCRKIYEPADVKQTISSQFVLFCFFFSFELGVTTKHLMTGPAENIEIFYPTTSMSPSALRR